MKILYTTLFFLCFFIKSNSQVVAYDFSLGSIGQIGFCFDLSFAKANIIGHQINVTVSFHQTLEDATDNVNPLKQLYTFSGGTERIIYARVSNISTNEFATSELELIKIPPFAPPGLCGWEICDLDSDGYELIDLNNFWCYSFDSFSDLDGFCDSLDSEIWTKYYLTQEDAFNEVNEISNLLVVNSDVTAYRKTKNINTDQYIIWYTEFNFINCNDNNEDNDNDGIRDILEDPNRNYDYSDDDTDKDGILNYQDNDDDNDGILTIDEDYNQNGNPTDDDIDDSGVADYLENLVTLTTNDNFSNSVLFFPNPASNYLTLQFKIPTDVTVKISDVSGKVIYIHKNRYFLTTHKIDLINFNSGIYFMTIETEDIQFIKKLIVK